MSLRPTGSRVIVTLLKYVYQYTYIDKSLGFRGEAGWPCPARPYREMRLGATELDTESIDFPLGILSRGICCGNPG